MSLRCKVKVGVKVFMTLSIITLGACSEEASKTVANDRATVEIPAVPEAPKVIEELLKDRFIRDPKIWTFGSGVEIVQDGVLVTVESYAVQSVAVQPALPYLFKVKARCAELPNVEGRLQVNWVDLDSRYISTSIEIFNCSESSVTHERQFIAPENARKALIYVAGHSSDALLFEEVSFRG